MRPIFGGGPQAPQPSLSQQPQQLGAGAGNVPPEVLAALLQGGQHLDKHLNRQEEDAAKRMALSDLMAQRAYQQPAQNAMGAIGQGMAAYAQGINERDKRNQMAASANQWMPVVTKDG